MGRQGVITTKTTRTVRIGIGKSSDSKRESTGKGVVNVPPHVRMVNGKPVFVVGYTYRR